MPCVLPPLLVAAAPNGFAMNGQMMPNVKMDTTPAIPPFCIQHNDNTFQTAVYVSVKTTISSQGVDDILAGR